MKKQLFWIFVALTIFVGFLVHKDPTSAQSESLANTSPNLPAAAFTSGNLVMYRVGDGSAALSTAGTAAFLDEYTTGGTSVQSLSFPTTVNGANKRFVASGSQAEGLMTRSVDGNYLVVGGYDADLGTTGVATTASSATNRVVARIGSNGVIDTTTALTDAATAGNIRGVTSTNGTDIWVSGSTGGSRYTTFGATTSTQLESAAPTNLRATAIFSGQLYITSASGTTQGVAAVGTGTPTTAGQTISLLPGFPTASGPSPYAFWFFNSTTLYVADDRAVAASGGVQKWTLSAGTWTNVATFNNGLTNGVRSLVVGTNGSNQAVIYGVTVDAPSKLVTVTDDGTATPAFTTLATTPTNTAWRGIAFAPGSAATPTPTATATPTPTPAPAVSSVGPTSGPSTGGTSVAITGTNFTGVTAVKFGATAATSFTFNSATSITAISPAGAGTVDVTVTTPGGTSATSSADQFTFTAVATPTPTPAPSVTSVSPNSGPTGGSTSIVITGTNFTGATAVSFGGTAAAAFSVTSPTQITATSPGHAAGAVDVTVTTSGGTSATSASDTFTYNAPSPTPTPTISPTPTPAHVQHVADFDGDGKTDFTILRDPSGDTDPNGNIQWWTSPNANPNAATVVTWGLASGSDHYLTGDYDGDHKADFVVWRQPVDDVHAAFWILRSSDGTAQVVPFGLAGDTPYVVGDYDGDGKDDVAIFRTDPNATDPTQPAEFWFQPSAPGPNQGQDTRVQWGIESDFPIPGDYNGDGKADMAVGRDNGDGTVSMWIHFGDGTGNPNTSQKVVRWGLTSDFYVPGDYDGDGKTDLAIVRSNGTNLEWWIQWSSDNSVHVATWGLPSDIRNAVQGDYDGDGKTDIGIWRASDATFYVIGSATGTPIYRKWGNAASAFDSPLPYNEH